MKKSFLTAISLLILLPAVCLAASTGLGSSLTNLGTATKGSGLETGTLSTLEGSLGLVLKIALSLVGTVFLVLTVYAGILWMTASGKEEQTEKAGKIIKASVIGIFIVMSSYAITYFVTAGLGGTSGSSSTGSGTATGEAGCHKLGGLCVSTADGSISDTKNPSVVDSKNFDKEDPCDPKGTGGDDPFTGTTVALCDSGKICCELSESAVDGKFKCETVLGGTCVSGTSGCPTGTTQNGECDTGTWDAYCCVKDDSTSGSQ